MQPIFAAIEPIAAHSAAYLTPDAPASARLSSLALSSLHPLKSWSLRQSRYSSSWPCSSGFNDTSQGGYRYARSAEGSLTGIGGSILVLDDFQKPLDMVSDARRMSTNASYYHTVASRINNQNTGAIVAIGQRFHPDDLIGRLLLRGTMD
jgi:hypothetical protein